MQPSMTVMLGKSEIVKHHAYWVKSETEAEQKALDYTCCAVKLHFWVKELKDNIKMILILQAEVGVHMRREKVFLEC